MSNNAHTKKRSCTQMANQLSKELTSLGSADKAILFLRIFSGVLLFTQAITKSQDYIWLSEVYPPILGVDAPTVVSIVGIIEVVAGVLLTIGLFTRIVSILMAVMMMAAALLFFPGQTFTEGELKFVYAGIYVTLAIGGGGRYSFDNLIATLTGRNGT